MTGPLGGPSLGIGVSPFSMAVGASRHLPRWLKPDPKVPDTFGWRSWVWHTGHELLISPHHMVLWDKPYLGAAYWDDANILRGNAGIHARLVPKHWKILGWPDDDASSGVDENPNLVTGIVERFGRYVLGTNGWRAEQVIIRELMAPSTEIGLALERVYPDVIANPSPPDKIATIISSREASTAMARRMTWLAILWLCCAAGWFFALTLRVHA